MIKSDADNLTVDYKVDCKKSIIYKNYSEDFVVVLFVKHQFKQLLDLGAEADHHVDNHRRMRRMSTMGRRVARASGCMDNETESKIGASLLSNTENLGQMGEPQLMTHQSMRLMPKDFARQMAGSVRWFPRNIVTLPILGTTASVAIPNTQPVNCEDSEDFCKSENSINEDSRQQILTSSVTHLPAIINPQNLCKTVPIEEII